MITFQKFRCYASRSILNKQTNAEKIGVFSHFYQNTGIFSIVQKAEEVFHFQLIILIFLDIQIHRMVACKVSVVLTRIKLARSFV